MTDEKLQQLIEQYDSAEDYEYSGVLHIVLEDCNVRDHDIEYCHGKACEEGNDQARLIAAALYRRTPDERRQLLGWPEYYVVDEDGEHLWPDE